VRSSGRAEVVGARSPDVAIIGGGIIGTSAAAFLAEAGADVVLFERDRIGAGASGRNSGAIQDPFDPLLVDLHRESLAHYRELAERTPGFPLEREPAGLLLVDHDRGRVEAAARDALATRPDLEPILLSGRDLLAVEPALAPDVVACRLVTGFPVPPAAATDAFAARAIAAGARIHQARAAELWGRDGTVLGASVQGERVAAASVLVAAGPWSARVVDPTGAWRPVRALWGVNVGIALARPPRAVLEEVGVETIGTREGRASGAAQEAERTPSIFSLVTAAGSSSLGSTFLGTEPDANAMAPILRARGARFVPAIGDAPIESVRACARPQSLDGRPLLGAIPWLDRAFIATGHGPWGISLGPASARLVGDLILGRDVTIPPELRPERFRRESPAIAGASRGSAAGRLSRGSRGSRSSTRC
jgi:D-amino-acid dehydrogenase